MAVHSEQPTSLGFPQILGVFSNSNYTAVVADKYPYSLEEQVLQVISIDVSNTDPLSTTLDENLDSDDDSVLGRTDRLSGEIDCARVPALTVHQEGRCVMKAESCVMKAESWDPILRNSVALSTLDHLERTDIDQEVSRNFDLLGTLDHLDHDDPLNTMEPYAEIVKPRGWDSQKTRSNGIRSSSSTEVILNQPTSGFHDPTRVCEDGSELPEIPTTNQIVPNYMYVSARQEQPQKSAVGPETDQRITRVAAILRGEYRGGNTNQSNQDGLKCLDLIEDGYSTISKYRDDREDLNDGWRQPSEVAEKQSETVLMRQPTTRASDSGNINSTTRYSSCASRLEINTSRQKLLRDDKVRFGTLDTRKLEDVTKSVFSNGCYVNPWDTWRGTPSPSDGIAFMCTRNESGLPSKQELDRILPVLTPAKIGAPPTSGINVTWLGHAGLLVQFDGISILTDPIFSSFCGPASLLGYKRYRPAPCTVKELPEIHAVVISHSHYDHLDLPTVKQLNVRFGNKLRWFVPLGMKDWFTRTGVVDVIELDWWQENCIPSHSRVTFAFTPTKHWSMRNYLDRNKSLWGSWSIIGPNHSFFFAGDTGYCNAFKEIGQRYGPFDLAAIPIGAYKPRNILSPQHVDPSQAVQIHQDIQARQSIGIHWGTFELGKEHYLAPCEDLKIALDKAGLKDQDFFTLNHGETRMLVEEEDQKEA